MTGIQRSRRYRRRFGPPVSAPAVLAQHRLLCCHPSRSAKQAPPDNIRKTEHTSPDPAVFHQPPPHLAEIAVNICISPVAGSVIITGILKIPFGRPYRIPTCHTIGQFSARRRAGHLVLLYKGNTFRSRVRWIPSISWHWMNHQNSCSRSCCNPAAAVQKDLCPLANHRMLSECGTPGHRCWQRPSRSHRNPDFLEVSRYCHCACIIS